jgi:hypothetical protein
MTIQNKPTKEQLIKQLQDIPPPHTRKIVREYIPDSHFIPVFGNFTNFKIQAGLEPNLHVTRHEKEYVKQVINHDNNASLHKLNERKFEYAEKYLRPSSKRFQTIVIVSDIHSSLSDEFAVSCFVDTIKRVQPQTIVLAGDVMDFDCLSTHGAVDSRRFGIVDEMRWLDNFLTRVRTASPDSQITYLCGNHSERLLRHLANESPFIQELLSDYHNFNFAKLLGLDKFEVNFISQSDLCVYQESRSRREVDKNYIVLHDFIGIGHTPAVRKHNLISYWGHLHQYKTFANYSYTLGSYHDTQLGCLTTVDAKYCNSDHWNQGFVIVHADVEKKRVQNEYIDCTNDTCMIGGMLYSR